MRLFTNSFRSFVSLSQKTVSPSPLKSYKKLKNTKFNGSQHSLLTTRQLQNYFLKSFVRPNFDLKGFQRVVSFSQKTVSILSLKYLHKSGKRHFKRHKIFAFVVKVASKPFFKNTFYAQIQTEIVLNALPHFPRNQFQLRHSKMSKTLKKMRFSKVQNICF